jgi:transcriptional regulator with XRE-family HTH domain
MFFGMEMEFNPEALTELRKSQKLSRRQLADRIGVSQLTITGYEKGRTTPSVRVIGRLVGTLGCPLDALFRIRQSVA